MTLENSMVRAIENAAPSSIQWPSEATWRMISCVNVSPSAVPMVICATRRPWIGCLAPTPSSITMAVPSMAPSTQGKGIASQKAA